MHRHSRLILIGGLSGKRLYGNATATQLKASSNSSAPAISVPSAKSWVRKTQTPPGPAIPSQKSLIDPVTAPRKDKWTIANAKRSDTSRLTTNSQEPQRTGHSSSLSANVKPLGKWALPRPSSGPQTSPSSKGAGYNKPSADTQGSPASSAQKSTTSPPVSLPSSDLPHRKQTPSATAPSSHDSVMGSTSELYSRSTIRKAFKLPMDYSSSQVFRDDEDPRRQGKWNRNAPLRNNCYEYRRREDVKKPPTKKEVRRKPKQLILRRKDVYIPSTVTVATLAKLLKIKLAYLLNKMRRIGMEAEANYDYILSADYAALLAEEYGFNPVIDDEAAFDIYPPKPHPNPSSLPSRPPIITIMGHVDHGKTTLLDTLRSASVAKGEAGGITQHIGAFSVAVATGNAASGGPRSITFLDTPGHAAFSAMRARGANVTDIVVLVVAADDGIMPQTEEVISLLKKDNCEVDLVVAVNKIDKLSADPDAVKKALLAHGVQLEEFGGDVPAVHVSGLTGEGLPHLIETLSTVAEVRDLRAAQNGPVYGHVIESNVHKGLGSVATVLIREGCLKTGSYVISGTAQGKVRRMTDSFGHTVQSALPGMAVTVSGWKTLPKAGDEVLDGSEWDIKKAIANRLRTEEAEALQSDAEAINESRRQEREARGEGDDAAASIVIPELKELKLLIKADVSGSCEALECALHGIGNHIAISKVISTGVGDITESDIQMARAASATIVGFSVSASRSILSLAARNEVPIMTGNIIYRFIDDVRSRVVDMLPKVIETKVTGEATVLQLFDITSKAKQIIKVAGCRVTNGLIEKHKFARVIRLGHVIHEGSLDTMRQLKKDITEARKGTECGLSFKDYSDLQEGDMIQMYEKIEKPGVI